MASRADFSHEEWVTLQAVFCAIVLDVAIADYELSVAEARAWHREVDALLTSTVPLVQELLCSDIGAEVEQAVIDKAANTPLENLVREAGGILEAKASTEETEDYQRSLRSLAIVVAEASPGGDVEENKFLVKLNDLLSGWASV